MDEIRRLEQEINALQTQLRQQNAEAARVRQSLIDDNRRNLESLERLHSDKDTLQNEYTPLSLLDSIQGLLDDEATDAIQGVRAVGELESQRIESETDTAEGQKRKISGEIQSEISKLNAGLEKKATGEDNSSIASR